MTMFYGSYEHSIDERGRIAVPARYRPAFATGVRVLAGAEGCVEMYDPNRFEAEMALRLEGSNRSTQSPEGRRARRGVAPGVWDLELDRQGRILIPPTVREKAGLADRAIIVGLVDYVEIWDPARWETELASVEREMRADGGSGAAAGGA